MHRYGPEFDWNDSIRNFCQDHNLSYYDLAVHGGAYHSGGVSDDALGTFMAEYMKAQDLKNKNLLTLLDGAFDRIKDISCALDMALSTLNSKEDVRILTVQSDVNQLKEELDELRLLSDFK